jgi:hypothetical protein
MVLAVVGWVVLFVVSFSVTGLQAVAAALFFLIVIGLPLWLW